jgi:hypothetical protein
VLGADLPSSLVSKTSSAVIAGTAAASLYDTSATPPWSLFATCSSSSVITENRCVARVASDTAPRATWKFRGTCWKNQNQRPRRHGDFGGPAGRKDRAGSWMRLPEFRTSGFEGTEVVFASLDQTFGGRSVAGALRKSPNHWPPPTIAPPPESRIRNVRLKGHHCCPGRDTPVLSLVRSTVRIPETPNQ